MTSRDAVLIAALLFLGVGVLRDITRAEGDKGAGGGPLAGTLRRQSWAGFLRGLLWYLAGSQLLA